MSPMTEDQLMIILAKATRRWRTAAYFVAGISIGLMMHPLVTDLVVHLGISGISYAFDVVPVIHWQ